MQDPLLCFRYEDTLSCVEPQDSASRYHDGSWMLDLLYHVLDMLYSQGLELADVTYVMAQKSPPKRRGPPKFQVLACPRFKIPKQVEQAAAGLARMEPDRPAAGARLTIHTEVRAPR